MIFHPVFFHSVIYFVCFLLVWLGAGLVVSTVSSLAKSWNIPIFVVSFFLLGILTSLPELTIGAISVANEDHIIFAGNLLGGVIVIFLLIIPLLGLLGSGVKIPAQIDRKQMIFILLVILAPAFLTADQSIHPLEAVFLIILYCSLFLFFSFRQSLFQKVQKKFHKKKSLGVLLVGKVVIGIIILVSASNQIVNSTIYFAHEFHISPFFVSLIIVSLGTNIPELSIIFRSLINKTKDIAFADYLGSAAANTLLFGIFSLAYGKVMYLPNYFFQRFIFLGVGIVLFYVFARSKSTLSRGESAVLLSMYFLFIISELWLISTL